MSWPGKFLSGLRMPTRSSLVTKVFITRCHFTSKLLQLGNFLELGAYQKLPCHFKLMMIPSLLLNYFGFTADN